MASWTNICAFLLLQWTVFLSAPRSVQAQLHEKFEYPVRLIGEHQSEGRVEIRVNDTWGTVCGINWSENDAIVVCRQLGYESARVFPIGGAYYGQGKGLILMSNVNCRGTETDLASCPFDGFGRNDCSHENDAGVMCLPYEMPIRLAGGYLSSEGRVEVKVNGRWGTVCSRNWDVPDAKVVCSKLGFESPMVFAMTDAYFGAGTGPILMEDVKCTGHESSLSVCPFAGFTHHTVCDHNRDAGVICRPHELPVRLVGTSPSEGRVEIKVNGRWGTVCDNDWDQNDAQVVCRQLGFNSTRVEAYSGAFFGQGDGPIAIDHVDCTGTERHLAFCSSPGFGQHACTHAQDAGVDCHALQMPVRLIGDEPWAGRVEAKLNGEWGTICDNDWDSKDAAVVCRQLGFKSTYVLALTGDSPYGEGSGLIHMEHVQCTGSEEHLFACTYSVNVHHTCTHANDASVVCLPDKIQVRLPPGSGNATSAGRVEILLNNTWGKVCADTWTEEDAKVVCSQLGFQSSNAMATLFEGDAHNDVYMNGVRCVGTEPHISYCPYHAFGRTSCGTGASSGVICEPEKTPVRLVSNGYPWEGRVEIHISEDWGTVCDSGWDQRDAEVVCRQLGYNHSVVSAVPGAFYGQGTGIVILQGMNCDRSESNLLLCPGHLGDNNCGHENDAGVICDPTAVPVRVVGNTTGEGRVEIKLNGVWGTVCANYWDDLAAKVVCRQLGFNTSSAHTIPGRIYGHTDGPVLLDGVRCAGTESHLMFCSSNNYGQYSSNCGTHGIDAGVACLPFDIRLVGGSTALQGRLEISVNGKWGSVCDDNFDDNDAKVVCRQLGFASGGAKASIKATFGQGSGPVFITNLGCSGSEQYLAQCSYKGFFVTNCDHDEDAGVTCSES